MAKHKPIFDLLNPLNNTIMAEINLQVGGGNKNANLTLFNSVTNQPIAGVTWSNQQIVSNSNPSVANIEIPPGNPNMVIAQPLSEGSGTVVISASASYTDSGDGQVKTGNFSKSKSFNVIGAPHGATFDVPFT